MKVYLAAPYGSRDQIRQYADELASIGIEVTSTWLAETHDMTPGVQGAALDIDDAQITVHASADFGDIDRADVLVLFTAAFVGVEGGGGRHVETGYAIALDVPVIVVGEPENVFHRLASACQIVPTWHRAMLELAARHVTRLEVQR